MTIERAEVTLTIDNREKFLVEYETVKDLIDLPTRQREFFEAWVYSKNSIGQLALRFGVNRSTASRAIHGAIEKVTVLSQRMQQHEKKKSNQ